ncbi:MAG: hypothetical protein ACYC7L_17760 [Nitrospirota bacterium]
MAAAENVGSTSQITNILIPIATFITGYLLSVFEKFRENRRNVRNMKTILFKELSDNYKKLNPFVPSDMKFHPNLVQIPMLSGLGISTSVYDAYLNRLAELKSVDLEAIFDAYWYLQIYKNACRQFLEMKPEELDVQKSIEAKMKVDNFLRCMITTHSSTEKALRVFQSGHKFLLSEAENRGVEYNRVFKIAEAAAEQHKK